MCSYVCADMGLPTRYIKWENHGRKYYTYYTFFEKEVLHTHTCYLCFLMYGERDWGPGGLENFHVIVYLFALLDFVCFFYHEQIFTDEETETQTGLSHLPKIIQIAKKKKNTYKCK